MANFFTLTCPSCNGKLSITNDIDRFACGYCGNELIVKRGENVVSLLPVTQSISQIKQSVDRVAVELQIQRLVRERKELAELIRSKRDSFDYWYTSKSGLVGVIRGFTSSQKQQDKEELDKLYELAKQKRGEQEKLTALLSS